MMTTLTTVGYGDYLPLNVPEMAMLCLIMLLGTVVFSYVMGSVNDALEEYDSLNSGTDKMSELNQFLDQVELLHGKISDELKGEFYAHFSYYWQEDRLRNLAKDHWKEETSDLKVINQEYLDQLGKKTVFKIVKYLYSDIFYDFRFFFGESTKKESNFKYYMAFHFQPRKFIPGEYIVKEGERLQELYFSYYGRDGIGTVGVGPTKMENGNEVHKPVLKFKVPTIIGEYSILMDKPAISTYKVYGENICDVFAVPKQPFLNLLETYYPANRDIMIAYAVKKWSRIQKLIQDEMGAASRIFGSAYMGSFVDAAVSGEEAKIPIYSHYKKIFLKQDQIEDEAELAKKIAATHEELVEQEADLKAMENLTRKKEKTGKKQSQEIKDQLKGAVSYIEELKAEIARLKN